jgi:hypothetical protein
LLVHLGLDDIERLKEADKHESVLEQMTGVPAEFHWAMRNKAIDYLINEFNRRKNAVPNLTPPQLIEHCAKVATESGWSTEHMQPFVDGMIARFGLDDQDCVLYFSLLRTHCILTLLNRPQSTQAWRAKGEQRV